MTKDEYKDFQDRFERFFAREGIDAMGWNSEVEPSFSYDPCDCCRRPLGGTRHSVTGYNSETHESYEYSVCDDCLYYHEYGQLDDQTMLGMED